ncbi:MAG: hypothetical protein AAGE94_01975 [Acidobacteriota bacterium]
MLRSDARLLLYALLLLATVFAAGPTVASEFGRTSPLTIMPGTVEAEIPLAGLVVFGGEAYTATVVEPPRFGTWANEVYIPTDAFWHYGGDRVTLSVTRASGRTELETIVMTAGQPNRLWTMMADFETSGGVLDDSKYEILGDSSRVYLSRYGQLEGRWSLAVDLAGPSSGVRARTTLGGGITGVDQLGGKAAVNPDLPDGGGGGGGGNAPLQPAPFVLYSQPGSSAIEMKVEYEPNGAARSFVRGALDPAAFGCRSTCSTPWREIPTSTESVVSFWYGQDVAFHPGIDTYSFHFVVEPPDPTKASHDTLRDLPNRSNGNVTWAVGAMGDSVQSIDGTIYLDLIESWSDQLSIQALPRVIAEDFSGGSWSDRWQVLGPFDTATPFRYDSASIDWRGRINLRDAKGMRALLVDERPKGETRLRAEFEVGLGSADLGTNMVYTIWGTSTTDAGVGDPTGVHPVEIDVKSVKGQLHVRARALDDRQEEYTTRWLPVDTVERAALTPVVVHWWAKRGSVDGGVHLRVGAFEAKLSGLQNRALKVEEHGIGFWDLRAEGLTSPNVLGFADPQLSFDNILVVR